MTFLFALPWREVGTCPRGLSLSAVTVSLVAATAMALAGCATQTTRYASGGGGRYYDPKLGVWASPRVVADGEPVPRGGGGYLVGRPYTIGGRSYFPSERPEGYTVVGMASWYGDAFHGRRTANGEVFDKNSISAAHPTLPLPSYVRVTNTKNGRSMIVRVNDRGPYHGGRVMDVSQRVAEALAFKGEGTARIRVDYIGRASLAGSDDAKLMASLRVDGNPAELEGAGGPATRLADAGQDPEAPPPQHPSDANAQIARATEAETDPVIATGAPPPRIRLLRVPMPPSRPFDADPALRLATDSMPPRRGLGQRAVWSESLPPQHVAVYRQPQRPDAPRRPLVTFGGTVAQIDAETRWPEPPRRPRRADAGGQDD